MSWWPIAIKHAYLDVFRAVEELRSDPGQPERCRPRRRRATTFTPLAASATAGSTLPCSARSDSSCELQTNLPENTTMNRRSLTLPKLFFIVSTRAMLGAGVALLASRGLNKRTRRNAGLTLALVGAATTIPAARLVMESRRSPLERLVRKFR